MELAGVNTAVQTLHVLDGDTGALLSDCGDDYSAKTKNATRQ